ncbi:MAG: DNA-3-methyladenine glycosylase I [Rhodovibrionaceae bacterium]|nr:DNA-3-methyladenine glycosylase I [Rhodovibrionaceae bacterium]
MASYCEIAPGHPLHGPYHDREYGFPTADETVLFERLVLEINQAGLSWELMLKKRPAFQDAYDGFQVDRVASYGDAERQRLLSNPAIIRNRLKVDAAISNARLIQGLRGEYGSFAGWIETHHPLDRAGWVKLFRREGFRFVGGEIVGEFLMSIGILEGAHDPVCPVFTEIERLRPPWIVGPGARLEPGH